MGEMLTSFLLAVLVATALVNSQGTNTNNNNADADSNSSPTGTKKETIVTLDGTAFVSFNFYRLSPAFLSKADNEEFHLYFQTPLNEGLMYTIKDRFQTMYFALKDGYLIFVNQEGQGQPKEVVVGQDQGVRFNDNNWHNLTVVRTGRIITITVDRQYPKQFSFTLEAQFLRPSQVWLGGAPSVSNITFGRINTNFIGSIGKVLHKTSLREGSRNVKNEVNLIAKIRDSQEGVIIREIDWPDSGIFTVSTPRPRPKLTGVTLKSDAVYIKVDDGPMVKDGGSLSFKFSTFKPKGLLMYSASSPNLIDATFMALEIYDGNLYFVRDFGGEPTRTLLNGGQGVNDGQTHEVEIDYSDLTVKLDGRSKKIQLDLDEELPTNFGPLYVGGYTSPNNLPWHTWAREGYQGCIEDLTVNGDVIDLEPFVGYQIYGVVERMCSSMPQMCFGNRCLPGTCTNTWAGHSCDCQGTDYTGPDCKTPAWTGVFNGSTLYQMAFRPQQHLHHDDISFRFKTAKEDGLIFQTKAHNGKGYMRCEMEGGRLKVKTNLSGREQVFYFGNNLNDNEWHSAYLRRRAKNLELWVDDETPRKIILPNEDFFHNIDDVFVGGYLQGQSNPKGDARNFMGYIRNFRFGGYDLFDELQQSGQGPFYQYPNIPALEFGVVTIPDFGTHVRLPSLESMEDLSVNFRFKTFDEGGVLLLNEGNNMELFLIELFRGRVRVKLQVPNKASLDVTTPENVPLNDGKWHTVTVRQIGQDSTSQLFVAIDKMKTAHSYSGLENIELEGPLYIGGAPDSVLQKPHVKAVVSSPYGFRGCLSSLDTGTDLPDLMALARAQGVTLKQACQEIRSKCSEDSCANEGICHDHLNNGTTWCDCTRTGWAGTICTEEPPGYYYGSKQEPGLYGMQTYSFPDGKHISSDRDEIVFGVMTDQEDAVLARLQSGAFDDFIQFKLDQGYVVASYDTDGDGTPTAITFSDKYVSDGGYHIIRFVRTADKGMLYVDGQLLENPHIVRHGKFHDLETVYMGGVWDETRGVMIDDTQFRGILGGMYVNGELIFPYVKRNINTVVYEDVDDAPIPYSLGKLKTTVKPVWITDPPGPETTTKPQANVTAATPKPTMNLMPVVPAEFGGGGISFSSNPAGRVSVVVFPQGSGGSSVGVGPGGAGSTGMRVAGASSIMAIPSLPSQGPRAGALLGAILGLMLFGSSLIWAFYGCKPGCCAACGCLGGAGGGGAGAGVPMLISGPSASTGGGVGTGGGGANVPLLREMDMAGGTGEIILLDARNTGTGGGGGGGGDYVDSNKGLMATTNLDAMDTQSHVKSSTLTRNQLDSTTSYMSQQHYNSSNYNSNTYNSNNYNSSNYNYNTGTDFGNSTTADYDLAIGIHSNPRSATLPSRGMSTGYSTSTLASNYNYTMKNNIPLIVTPGQLGEEIRVDCCLMTSDGQSVATGSSLGPPQVWNMQDGELLRMMQGETVGSTYLHLVCNDRLLVGAINADLDINQLSTAKGVHNYIFQIWDFATGRPLDMADQEVCSALTVMSDTDKVVFGRSDHFGGGTNIIVWDLIGNQAMKEMRYDAPVGNNDYVSYIALSQGDRYVVAGFTNTFDNQAEFVIFDMTLTSFNVSDPHILRLDAVPECTAILPNDEAVTGLRTGDLIIWSLKTGQPQRQMVAFNGRHAHTREVKAVARSEDNRYLVSASADGTLRVWDMESETLMHTLSGHHDEVWCTAISMDSEIVVSGSRDGNIRLWKLKSGREICAFNAGVDVFYITMSQDKGTIVALGDKFGARKLIMLQVVRSKIKKQVLA